MLSTVYIIYSFFMVINDKGLVMVQAETRIYYLDNQAEKLRELLFFESAEKKKTRKSKR